METVNCPLCGAAGSKPVATAGDLLYGMPGKFTVARCEACRHAFLNPRPPRESIGQFYVADYGPFRETSRATKPRRFGWLKRFVLFWIDSRATRLPAELDSLTQARVLELGCATGTYLDSLRQRGWRCVGLEPTESAARVARERSLHVITGSLESSWGQEPELQPASFDAIFAWMVVEHLHDPVATLRLARKLLKPRGWLLLSVPNFGCWERLAFGRFWYALQLPTHLQHFTPVTICRLLEASGLELVELIPQRNVNNLVGSVGLWLRIQFPRWSLGERLIRWTDNPSALGLCLLSPVARLLALIHQSGRLTVVARRH